MSSSSRWFTWAFSWALLTGTCIAIGHNVLAALFGWFGGVASCMWVVKSIHEAQAGAVDGAG